MGDSNVRTLTDEQIRDLLAVHTQLDVALAPREMLRQLAARIAAIIHARTAFVGRREGQWIVLAESEAMSSLPPLGDPAWRRFDAVAGELGLQVELWHPDPLEWTLVGLRPRGDAHVVLLLEGDWRESESALLHIARTLLGAGRAGARAVRRPAQPVPASAQTQTTPSHAQLAVAAHRLTRALARVSGERDVCDTVLRHIVRALPSRIAAFALPMEDDQLAIVSTHGYSRTLVEHVRIPAGTGVMGTVYQRRMPMRVQDVRQLQGRPRRLRYRTNSFIAVPVVAGSEVLGVVSLTDRADDQPFTRDDLTVLRALTAPASLALGRERERRQAQSYAHAAAVDVLSGLYNRRYFQSRLEEELQRRRRTGDPVALMLVDIDDFKKINDTYGHVAGDIVIAGIGDILRRSVRVFDVCARFGGEEFAILMPGNPAGNAANTAERIRQRIEAFRPADEALRDLRVTASIGLAVAADDVTGRDLIERADRALYLAKRSGKNQLKVDSSE